MRCAGSRAGRGAPGHHSLLSQGSSHVNWARGGGAGPTTVLPGVAAAGVAAATLPASAHNALAVHSYNWGCWSVYARMRQVWPCPVLLTDRRPTAATTAALTAGACAGCLWRAGGLQGSDLHEGHRPVSLVATNWMEISILRLNLMYCD